MNKFLQSDAYNRTTTFFIAKKPTKFCKNEVFFILNKDNDTNVLRQKSHDLVRLRFVASIKLKTVLRNYSSRIFT